VQAKAASWRHPTGGSGWRSVAVLTRPEDITLLPKGELGPNEVSGRIEHVAYMGDHLEYTIAAADARWCCRRQKSKPRGRRRCAFGIRSLPHHDPAAMSQIAASPLLARRPGRFCRPGGGIGDAVFFAVVMVLPILFLLIGSFKHGASRTSAVLRSRKLDARLPRSADLERL